MAFNPKRALERAEKHAAKGQHDKAAREYQAVVDANPKDVRAWLMLADCLVRCGQRDKAIDRYLRVAQFYADAKQPSKALAVYRQILNIDPSRLDIHTKVGKINQEMGRIADAVACYEAVAQAKLKAGHIQEALKVYELVAETDSRSLSKRLRLAELYSREKMLSQAVENFRIAARQLFAEEKYTDFIRVAERLIYHKESDTETLRELARAYMKTGDPRRALVKLNALLHVDQSDVEGLELLAEAFMALEKPEKAVRVVGELAREHRKRGADGAREALRVLDRGLGWDSKCKELLELRDEIEQGDAGDLQDVPEDIEELDDGDVEELDDDDVVLEELPDSDSTPLTATVMSEVSGPGPQEAGVGAAATGDVDKVLLEVQTYLKYKLFDHALEHLRMVLDGDPHHTGALELNAQVLAELGRKDEAATAYARLAAQIERRDPSLSEQHARRALEHVPRHAGAMDLLARLSSRGEPDETDFSDLDDVSLGGAGGEPDSTDFGDSDMFDMDDEDEIGESAPEPAGTELPVTLGLKATDTATFDELAATDSAEIDIGRDEPDFAIHLQETEPSGELEEPEPVSIEDRFGLSEDGEPETPESEEEVLGAEDEEEDLVRQKPELAIVGEAVEDLVLDADEEPVVAEDGELVLGADEPEEEAEEEKVGAEEEKVLAEEAKPTAEEDAQELPDIEDDVAEIRFFMAQDLAEDAELAFDELKRRHPDHPQVIALGEELAPMRTPLEQDDEASKPLVELEEEDQEADEYLSAIFGDAPKEPKPKPAAEPQARANIEDADPATLFDLGTAYVEMGLVDDAITQLMGAAEDEHWKARSLVVVAGLRARRGETDEAVVLLSAAIEAASTPDELSEARYELSLLCEEIGDTVQAVELLEAVKPGFRDREERLSRLRIL